MWEQLSKYINETTLRNLCLCTRKKNRSELKSEIKFLGIFLVYLVHLKEKIGSDTNTIEGWRRKFKVTYTLFYMHDWMFAK